MKNVLSNIKYGMLSQVSKIVLQFITRKVFLSVLGVELLGVHSLFISIISMLTMTELGVGAAVAYSLYKPLAENNTQKVAGIMCLYRKIYRVIGVIILIVGCCLLPFIPNIVNTNVIIPNLRLMFFIIVLKCAFTYLLFAYSQTLLIASECKYKVDKLILIFTFITSIGEIVVLLLMKNYVLYLSVEMVCLITQQYLIYRVTKKMYPEIMTARNVPLGKNEKKSLWRNVYGLSISKFSGAVLSSIDNIIISTFISTAIVGYYANYSLIQTAAVSIISMAFVSVTANIGHKFTSNSIKEEHLLLMFFVNFVICAFCTVLYYFLINDFISLFFSPKLVLGHFVVLAIVINMLISYMGLSIQVFKDASGIFWYGKYRPVLTCFLNVGFSLLLVNPCGIAGVVFATVLSRFFTTLWFDPYLVYKYAFKQKPTHYFITYLYYVTLIFLIIALLWIINTCFLPSLPSVWLFCLKTVLAIIVTSIIIVIGTCRMQASRDALHFIILKIRKQ